MLSAYLLIVLVGDDVSSYSYSLKIPSLRFRDMYDVGKSPTDSARSLS